MNNCKDKKQKSFVMHYNKCQYPAMRREEMRLGMFSGKPASPLADQVWLSLRLAKRTEGLITPIFVKCGRRRHPRCPRLRPQQRPPPLLPPSDFPKRWCTSPSAIRGRHSLSPVGLFLAMSPAFRDSSVANVPAKASVCTCCVAADDHGDCSPCRAVVLFRSRN